MFHEMAGFLGYRVFVFDRLLKYQIVEVPDLVGFEGHVTVQNREETYSSGPDVYGESLVAYFSDDLGSDISWCSALLE